MTDEVKHLPHVYRTSGRPFYVCEVSVNSFARFCFCFLLFLLGCLPFHISDAGRLSDVCHENMFSLSVTCLFTLTLYFEEQTLLVLT